jgi:hypothetical protein
MELDDSLEKVMKQAKSSLEIEGFKIEEYHTNLVRKVLGKEISEEDFKEEVLRMAAEKVRE